MVDILDSIDWSDISTCFGSASEIPVAIQLLFSKEAEDRSLALGTLSQLLEHQGSLCEATPLAVPFLLEVLADARFREKRTLIDLMTYLCSPQRRYGERYLMLEQRAELRRRDEGRKKIRPGLRDLAQEWENRAHQMLRKGLPLFCSWLSDPDPLIREQAAFLLAAFPEDASWLAEPVMDQLSSERDEYTRCSLLLCLGHLQAPRPELVRLLLSALKNGETPLLEYAAARAVCLVLKELAPENVIDLCCRALTEPRYSWRPGYEPCDSPWSVEDTYTMALNSLAQLLLSAHFVHILAQLCQVYLFIADAVDEACADLLLYAAFGLNHFTETIRSEEGERSHFEDLMPQQQQVLHLLAERESLWNKPGDHFDPFSDEPAIPRPFLPTLGSLAYLGFPSTRQGLCAFLRGEKPSSL